ncbi:sensor histidine kinase [Companilactobacillus hulinensis]|uniref:sensor histidine kinase n=1 Tax=Companilactobacillus hulinensis TaxID=2486007 RepID=UPI000F7AE165|nr:GHKL domain-containing protein [Companilactobacillus hulinensis]
MIYVGIGAYTLGVVTSWIITFGIFFLVYNQKIDFTPLKAILTIVLFFATAATDYFADDWSYLVFIFGLYLIFSWRKRRNYFILSSAVATSITIYIVDILMSAILIPFVSSKNIQGYTFTFISGAIELILSIVLVSLYRHFNISRFIKTNDSPIPVLLLSYFFIVLSIFMNFIHHFNIYRTFLIGILFFVVIQLIVLLLIFLLETKRQKNIYQQQLSQEQFKNLKMYTDQLERDQLNLRKFKHDYENMLLSLRTIADSEHNDEWNASLDKFESYSDNYFSNVSMKLYKDLNNIQNPYLKSLFISKLNKISHENIKCSFECHYEVNEVPINIFDLVRLLGIAIDNAIDEAKKQVHGNIQLAIINEAEQMTFIVDNTVTKTEEIDSISQLGYSTKKNHSGFGLSNIQEIKKRYPNLLIQNSERDNVFHLQYVILKGAVK